MWNVQLSDVQLCIVAGVDLICVTKEEGVSEAGRRMCEKGSISSGQEATSTIPDPELKVDLTPTIVELYVNYVL